MPATGRCMASPLQLSLFFLGSAFMPLARRAHAMRNCVTELLLLIRLSQLLLLSQIVFSREGIIIVVGVIDHIARGTLVEKLVCMFYR